MYPIQPEGLKLVYFTALDDVAGVRDLGRVNMDVSPFMAEYLPLMNNVRMVAFEHRGGTVEPLYLYWSEEKDLGELDRRVAEGTWSDADFELSILTFYQPHWCVYCNSVWDALVVCGFDFYLGHKDLCERKTRGKWHRVNTCPKCGSWLRQLVVEIYGPSAVHAPRASKADGSKTSR